MDRLTSTFERTTIAVAAFALSTLTLVAATLAPMNADQPELVVKGTPTVEVVMVSMQPATRIN